MKNLCCVLASTSMIAACGTTAPAPPAAPAQTPAPKAYGTLAQVMQAIPFHNSNIIFDAEHRSGRRQEGRASEEGCRGHTGIWRQRHRRLQERLWRVDRR